MRIRRKAGYTLIELLVVVTIIVILASLLMVAINKAIAKAAFVSCQNNLRNLGGMIQEYTLRNGSMLPEFTRYRWIGQVGYLEQGEFGWTLGSELPQEIQDGLQNKLGTFDPTGMYFPIYDRQDSLFVCPTGRRQLMNLQGVRSSYSGLSIRDYQNVDSIDDPMKTLLLFEYDANEVNVLYADQSTEISYITDTVQRPDPGQTIPAELYRVALNHEDCGNVLFMDKHIECVKGEETLILSWEEDYSTSSSTTSTSTTSTSTTSTTTTTVRTTTTPTTTVGVGGGGGGSNDPIIGGTSSILGPGSGTTTTVRLPGGGGDTGSSTSSVATTSTSTTTTSISTTTSTSSTTIRRYLGPPF